MKSIILVLALISSPLLSIAKALDAKKQPFFVENNGQIVDQGNKARKDIQFSLGNDGMSVFIGNGHIHYQFSQPAQCIGNSLSPQSRHDPIDIKTYRVDVALLGANPNAEICKEAPLPYYEMYYGNLSDRQIKAHTFQRIVYRNIYPNIDWVLISKNGHFEYEFEVRQGGDPSKIRLKYRGQQTININERGNLALTTPMGTIEENAPVCYSFNGKKIFSEFILQDNVLSFGVDRTTDAFVLDPAVEWATYYGPDTSTSKFYALSADLHANVYGCGLTYAGTTANIATAGSFDAVYSGNADAYLVKFDSSENRLWATYYGGEDGDWATAVTCDQSGNVYLGGSTASLSGIATPGSAQTAYGGGLWSGFLVKFDSSGMRSWGTYVGGSVGAAFDLEIASVSCDLLGHVYVSGATDDTNNVATPGAYIPVKLEGMDTTVDCYLIQYDTSGAKLWGTYYGGPGRNTSYNGASCTDGYNVYLVGWTNDTIGNIIATPGSYQESLRGNTDAFIAKFDAGGNRLWGTYLGGESGETTGGIAYLDNNVYILGGTTSDSGIASPGSFTATRGGGTDAFLAKLNCNTGMRQWGTYFGGAGQESIDNSRICAANDNIFIVGSTNSTDRIVSAGAIQPVYGGGDNDAFIADFDTTGRRLWSTYYGGTGWDEGRAVCHDGEALYICGLTNSTSGIATPTGFQPSGGGGTYYYPGFLAKFNDLCTLKEIYGRTSVCIHDSIQVKDSTSGGLWSSSDLAIATVGSSSGWLKGLSAGAFTITYSLGGCYVVRQDTVVTCLSQTTLTPDSPTGFNAYPNPNDGHFILTGNVPERNNKVTITNMLGEEIWAEEIQSVNGIIRQQIKLPDYAPQGVYFITIKNATGLYTLHFEKIR